MSKKTFPTLAVVGAACGYLLEQGGMAKVHEVLDHLYPGIGPAGAAIMADQTEAYLAAAVPGIASLPPSTDLNRLVDEALRRFGPTIEVPGPAASALDTAGLERAARALAMRERMPEMKLHPLQTN